MTSQYYCGAAAGMLTATVLTAAITWSLKSTEVQADAPALESHIGFGDATHPVLVHGVSHTITLTLRNRSSRVVSLNSMRFTAPWVEHASPASLSRPVAIAPKASIDLPIRVTARAPHTGRLQVGCLLETTMGGRPYSMQQFFEIECAALINADPAAVTFGNLAKLSDPQAVEVALWHPAHLRLPEILRVEGDDPSIGVMYRPASTVHEQGGRIYFGSLFVTVDPRRMPPVLRSNLRVNTAGAELSIPCFGWGPAKQ